MRRPRYAAPELLATRPNEVWSWDITKLMGPAKWTYFYLYVILDIFSRYVVGWMLAPRESAALAEHLIAATCAKHGIRPGQLTLHADRGWAMRSKPVALLLADLGVRPCRRVSRISCVGVDCCAAIIRGVRCPVRSRRTCSRRSRSATVPRPAPSRRTGWRAPAGGCSSRSSTC